MNDLFIIIHHIDVNITLMSRLDGDKLDAVRQNIEAAIELFFEDQYPIAVHVLASAALNVLHDLSKKLDKLYINQMMKQIIIDGTEQEFWCELRKPYSYFKHADRDSNVIQKGVEEAINDHIIFLAFLYYDEITKGSYSRIMFWFVTWYTSVYPNHTSLPSVLKLEPLGWDKLARQEQIIIGKEGLDVVKTSLDSGSGPE